MEQKAETGITWQYIAGFFDGEGCIYDHRKRRNRVPFLSLDQKIDGTNVLQRIGAFLEQNDVRYKTYGRPDGPYQTLRVHDRLSCSILLRGMLPFLIVKKNRAEQALHWLSTHNNVSLREDETAERLRRALHAYQSGQPIYHVMRMFHVGGDTLKRYAGTHGTSLRSLSEAQRLARKMGRR